MTTFNKNRLIFYIGLSFAAGVLSAVLISAGNIVYRIINALFIGGLVSLIPGLISYVRSLGIFDLFFFGFKTLRRYSKHFEDEQVNEPESYYEFKMEKGVRQFNKEPVSIGIILLSASIILTMIFV